MLLIFVIFVTGLLLSGAIAYTGDQINASRRERRAGKNPPGRPPHSSWSDLYIDRSTLMLVGPEWRALAGVPCMFHCPGCDSLEANACLQQYLHLPTRSVVAMLRHDCPGAPEVPEFLRAEREEARWV